VVFAAQRSRSASDDAIGGERSYEYEADRSNNASDIAFMLTFIALISATASLNFLPAEIVGCKQRNAGFHARAIRLL